MSDFNPQQTFYFDVGHYTSVTCIAFLQEFKFSLAAHLKFLFWGPTGSLV